MVSLSACATAPSEEPACPREQEYSKEFLNKLADELDKVAPESPIMIAMIDYGALRNGARACRGEKVEKVK